MAAQAPSTPCWDYDVFLSFRGEDTRKNFTDHLYKALAQVGICSFRDNEELRRGKTISTELCKAIHGSRIFVVVFSKYYASSTWCLDELAEMVECCRKNIFHILLPIFYHVDPSDVRKQTGTFAEAFAKHEKRFHTNIAKVERWKEALTEAGSLSGWDLSSVADGYEGKFIEEIVDQVLREVNPVHFQVAEYPVGIDSRVEEMKALLNLETREVRIVGIYGMSGIGKTTVAKAVYNHICFKFERSSCLLDIKEISEKAGGLVQLQKQLLYEILKKDLRIDHIDKGIELIKKLLNGKRVLVVLDDVVDLDQLHKLLGDLSWFGLGSRVIITTRDEHLLTQLKVHESYEVSPLSILESLKLFSWHAFEMTHPRQGFLELSTSAVEYVEGLPLALKVLGSFLKERSIVEWKSELEKLQKKPHDKIQKILRISFDSLERHTKEVFLDIACFFIGEKKDYATKIIKGCGFFPDIDMKILEQRSLLKMDYYLRMHSLIRDMGREIVRENATYIPENYSRLWFREDVLNVLSKHMGSQHVKGLNLNSLASEDLHLKTEAFTNMKNLRLLQINAVHLTGNFKHLSNELRWLCWHKCPLKFLPQDFHLENLVVLELQQSKVLQVWKGYKIFNKLKVLNLQNSEDLIKSPNFSGVPHLEILILEGCTRMVEVHESIGCLKGLVELNLRGCSSLTNLPSSILNLQSLKTLDMSHCLKLFQLSKQVGNMMALTEMHGIGTALEQRLSFFSLLKNLKIKLFGCEHESSNSWLSYFSSWISPNSSICISSPLASISRFHSLKELNLICCGLSEDNFPLDMESLSSLAYLDLSKNNFCNTPHAISHLPKLEWLRLDNCTVLQSISEVPQSLEILLAVGCISLNRLSNSLDMEHLPIFSAYESYNQVNWRRSLIPSPFISAVVSNDYFQHMSTVGASQFPIIFLQNMEVPDTFGHQAIGSLISFRVPPFSKGLLQQFLVCASYRPMPYAPNCASSDGPVVTISFYNKTRGSNLSLHAKVPLHFAAARCHIYPLRLLVGGPLVCYYIPEFYYFPSDSQSIYMVQRESSTDYCFSGGDEMEVSIEFRGDLEVQKCGIRLKTRPWPPGVTIYGDGVARLRNSNNDGDQEA